MEIKFNLVTQGYFDATFSTSDKKVKIEHSSDYGDKFQILLNNLFYIFYFKNKNEEFYSPLNYEIIWEDDFINYKIEIQMQSLNSNIKFIVSKFGTGLNNLTELIGEISFDSLFKDIFNSLDNLYKEFGLYGYKEVWEVGNFPIYEYILLKSRFHEKNIEKLLVHEDEEWKSKIINENIHSKELNLLNYMGFLYTQKIQNFISVRVT